MSHFEDIEKPSNESDVEIDDSELDENEDVFAGPEKNLMPELPFEQEVSENDIRSVIEKFARNFAEVYPSSGPALYMGPLNEAMNHSLDDSVDRRPLLLYLHRNSTPSTHLFCKNILCNNEIINYIESNYLVWAWDCTRDANYQRFLLMLLEHAGPNVTATVVKIPIDDYPQLICLLYDQGQINAIKVIYNSDDSTSPDEIYMHLLNTREQFNSPMEIVHNEIHNLSVVFSDSWSPPPSQLQILDQQTDEFRNVASYFADNHFRIVHIERIENKTWRKIYKEEKKTIDKRLCFNQTDCVLFHGCLRKASEEILQRGFNTRIVGIHGTDYGDGFYFSTNPMRSYMYALPDLSRWGERTMLVCHVIIGNTRHDHSMMETYGIQYDSVTDGSEIYVVSSNRQILPEYRVTYKYIS
ncbi:unnamed protein product [Rotaria sordida]|uniref:Poly [ADP-ribose] polymerase n=1 Tax=Rotaria sordida TaxID=392033 RepID=A0A819A3Q1_9BILA|nr:unnamed protein product [Rotaria sordida]CAF1056876.1 unnamed protein product [Rotaria sordida]CAF1067774.1 unnamed protein product [Rotaria sordida]CAF1248300.1 unnamed protein product [Rotaria sordida]CAF3776183.1 unnamed protein product [Rotaria sordida]